MKPLSQRDPKWSGIKLGFSNDTLGTKGCTVTCLAIIAGLTPVEVNELLKKVGGFAQKNLVIWKKIKEAIPWLEWEWRNYVYDNEQVKSVIKDEGACLVEVDARRIGGTKHWVVYIGNGRMFDPYYGNEKTTGYYPPLGFSVIKIGKKTEEPSTDGKQVHYYTPGEENEDPNILREDRNKHWNALQDNVRLSSEIVASYKAMKEKADNLVAQKQEMAAKLGVSDRLEDMLEAIRELKEAEDSLRTCTTKLKKLEPLVEPNGDVVDPPKPLAWPDFIERFLKWIRQNRRRWFT